MKGNSECHCFSAKGSKNYENIVWSSDKCKHRRSIGKNRILCMEDESNGYCDKNNCPLK